MEKLKILQNIKTLYAKGGNILEHLKKIDGSKKNSIEDILISYDFQSGSYTKSYFENRNLKDTYCQHIAKVIERLGDINSIMEVGVGEATTLAPLLNNLQTVPDEILGFDISWSRIKYAKEFFKAHSSYNAKLFTGNLFEIPLMDNSIEVVYTSHSIEPNGGNAIPALEELYRVASKYIVLLEPAYELANSEQRARMEANGYITDLYSCAKEKGYKILEHRLFDLSINPMNPTALIIIEKGTKQPSKKPVQYACPITKTTLTADNGVLFSKESLLAYPLIQDIPCLLSQNAIIATHYSKEV